MTNLKKKLNFFLLFSVNTVGVGTPLPNFIQFLHILGGGSDHTVKEVCSSIYHIYIFKYFIDEKYLISESKALYNILTQVNASMVIRRRERRFFIIYKRIHLDKCLRYKAINIFFVLGTRAIIYLFVDNKHMKSSTKLSTLLM